MTCRRGSTRAAFMEFSCLPAHCCSIFLRRLRGQGLVHNQERRSPQLRPKFSRGRKPSHPHNLIPAHDHRPKSALRLGHMTLLQQFLDLLGALVFSEVLIPSGIAGLIVTISPFWMVGVEALLPGGERLHGPT